MTLKLYSFEQSSCGKRVAVVLHEKKVPFELIVLNFTKKEHQTPEHLKHQPFGQAPYIDDDGFILYESRAIARYIAEKYADQGVALIPTDLKAKALFEQAASIETFNFFPYASGATGEMFRKPLLGLTPDKEVYNDFIQKLSAQLDVYDQILANQKYLAGDDVTLADLDHLPLGNLLSAVGSDILYQKPNVARWWKDLTSRPSWQAVAGGIKSATF